MFAVCTNIRTVIARTMKRYEAFFIKLNMIVLIGSIVSGVSLAISGAATFINFCVVLAGIAFTAISDLSGVFSKEKDYFRDAELSSMLVFMIFERPRLR